MRTGICPFCGKKVDKFIMFRGDVVGCRYCGIHAKQTNYDRLISKTPEEMAAWIADHPVVSEYDENNPQHKALLEWLKQEAHDG